MKDEALRLLLEAIEICAVRQEHQWYGLQLVSRAKAAAKQALAQPEQKPVAWLNDCEEMYFDKEDAFRYSNGFIQPLYTSPPKREWQGLTDVDVSKILDEQNGFYTFEKCFNFAKAIEAKLKERNT